MQAHGWRNPILFHTCCPHVAAGRGTAFLAARIASEYSCGSPNGCCCADSHGNAIVPQSHTAVGASETVNADSSADWNAAGV